MKYYPRVKGLAFLTPIVILILTLALVNSATYAQPANQQQFPAVRNVADVPGAAGVYTLNAGDTLSYVAAEYNTSVERLLELNPQIENRAMVYAGQQILVPARNEGRVSQAGQTQTPQADDQQQTQTPQDDDQQQTPTGTAQPDQQATPMPEDEDQQDDEQVPVTGEHEGFSVAEVAQPGQSGEIDLQIQLVKVADGFNDPVNVVAAPDGSGRLFVVERNGVVRVVQDGELVEEPFLDLRDITLDAFLEQGLYDLEFHPDFANNGLFYVHFAELLRNGDSMIVEYSVSDDDENAADPESARVIMQIEQPWANHNGGELAFGPDGYLYIGSGDGGWEGDPLEAGQDLSTLLGKLLRIDVNTDGAAAYRIPEDNPFAQEAVLVQLFNIEEETFAQIHTEARPEIWAYGLRNPWKFQFDPETGDLYLPDVGQNHWEEINFQPADSAGGENYGWDILMGTYCFPINAEDCPAVGVLPVAEYDHDLGVAVVGIGVYRGEEFSAMDGIYFVGDWGSGRIWGLQRGDDDNWIFDELIDTDTRITGSGQGEDGRLYVTTCNCEYGGGLPEENQPGSLWYVVPADQVPEGAETAPTQAQVPVTGEDGTVRAPLEEQQPVALESVAEGLTAPVYLTNAGDGSGRLFIVEQVGQIRILDENGELLEEPFLDVSDRMVELRESFDERGLLGLAFHPDYANNGRFFVYYSAPLRADGPEEWDHTAHIAEFSVSEDDPNVADPDSEQILLQVDEPQFNHDGGTVMFGPDGYLYISFGDGGGADDNALGHVEDWYDVNEGGNGQDISDNLLGSILRIDVDSEGDGDRPYGIPEDNPFVGQEGDEAGLEEIYAFGFRNPYRFSFDRGGENQLFAADVGQNAFEEVNIVELGGNYGWNVKEGTHCFSTTSPDEPIESCPDVDPDGNPLIDPVIEYVNNNQEDGIGISVTGGFVYRGEQNQEWQGNYIFGDWSLSFDEPSGRLFMSEPQDEGLWPIIELVPEGMDFNYFVTGFGEDENGELYVTTSQSTGPTGETGAVFRLVPAQEGDEVEATPQVTATPTEQGGQGQATPTPTSEDEMQTTPTPTGEGQAQPTPTQGQADGDQDDQQLVEQGEQVFTSSCTACHGVQGQARIGPALAGNNLVTQDDPTEVILTVLNGSGQMPSFKDQLSHEEIAQVVSYIRNDWENEASVVSPEQVSQVAEGGSAGSGQIPATGATPTQGGQQAGSTQQTPTPGEQQGSSTQQDTSSEDMSHAEDLWSQLQDENYKESWSTLPNLGTFYRGLPPHGELLSTYLNDPAIAAVESPPGEMPENSIIVKENYNADQELQAVTIMQKLAGFDAEYGDWFYARYGPDGEVQGAGRMQSCIACHGAVSSNDYIYTFPVAPIEP